MAAAWRTVRVFISSTFRDMHAEREELVKRVLPQLRKLCEEQGVGWTEVDLRRCVTEEQARRGADEPWSTQRVIANRRKRPSKTRS